MDSPELASGLATGVVRARAASEFVNTIGANVHLSYFQSPYGKAWSTVVKPKILALGIRHLRDGGVVVTDDSWMRLVYGRMKELQVGKVTFNLVMQPAIGTTNYTSLPQFNRLLSFALPAIESFEGLNEHDLSGRAGWVGEVRSFQRSLYSTVKADARTARMPVFGPALGNPGHAAAVGDLSTSMNYGSIHPYPGGQSPMATFADNVTKIKPLSGPRRLVATESGYHTAMRWVGDHPPVSEKTMAHYTLRLLFDYFNAGIPRTWLYEFIDEGTDPSHREQNFGLLRYNGSEKPAYVALKNLIALLNDPGAAVPLKTLSYNVTGDVSTIQSTLLQKRDGRFYLVLWQDPSCFDILRLIELSPAAKRVTLTLPAAATIKTYLPVNSTAPVQQVQAASLTIDVPSHPVVIEIKP